ncbi:MAG: hypothetical protein SOW55_05940 [Bacilli bacterium]|nr:hypothetical protein [Bacillales bacterium]MDY2575488.1 hypothetical protein [Bacilli bacterium]
MRKNAKYVFSTVLALFLSVTTVSCSKDETKRKELGEEQIKENFSNEVTNLSLSKDSVNEAIQSVVTSSKEVDVNSMLDSIHISNAKASITKTIGEKESSYDAYTWQKEDKIYFGSEIEEKSTVYLLDLGTIKETISNAGSVELPDVGENTIDYVDLILSSLDVNIDLDQYLSKIKFSLNDFEFDYKNKTFTFTKEKLVEKVSEVLGITDATTKTMISTYLGEFSFQIGYDGYNFNEYKLVLKPNLPVGSFNPSSSSSLSIEADLKLTHNLSDEVTSSSLTLDVNSFSSSSFSYGGYNYSNETTSTLSFKLESTIDKVNMSIDSLNEIKKETPSYDYELDIYNQMTSEESSKVNMTVAQDNSKKTLKVNGNIEQSYSSKVGEETEEYNDKVVLALDASENSIDLSIKNNDKEVVSLKANKKDEALSAEFIYTNYDENDATLNEVTKVVITNDNVTIPSSLIDQEISAIDVTQEIIDSLGNIEIDL